jgi:hypothetical protein
LEKEALGIQGIEPTQAICDEIDMSLAPIFWANVNPLLRTPLTKLP